MTATSHASSPSPGHWLGTAFLAFLLASCASGSGFSLVGEPLDVPVGPSSEVKHAGSAPSPHEVIRALFANLDVPLAIHPSCTGVGTRADDRTIGDYLAGFVAAYADPGGRNWIGVRSWPLAGAADATWDHEVVLHRRAGEEVWGWGVRFERDSRTGRVRRDSFRCIG